MTDSLDGLELRSTITADGALIVGLSPVSLPPPSAGHVIVQVEASPINPSDLAILLGPSDLHTLVETRIGDLPGFSAEIPPSALAAVAARVNQPMVPGNEGAGLVVAAGAGAEHLLGRRVGMRGGAMYTQYRALPADDCVLLPNGVSSEDGAAMFINPLTALCFVETMRIEKHQAIVHFAAASSLGQMLNRICIADGIPLVNIVRSAAHAGILRNAGAAYVLDSTAPDFQAKLTDAIAETGATLCFDPIGGGRQASQVLRAMEDAASRSSTRYNRYGTDTLKQIYIYGTLNLSPTILDVWVGFAWNVGGWLLTNRMRQIGPERVEALRRRVVDELRTTFASHYTQRLSLQEALLPENVRAYGRKATGAKYLITPHLP